MNLSSTDQLMIASHLLARARHESKKLLNAARGGKTLHPELLRQIKDDIAACTRIAVALQLAAWGTVSAVGTIPSAAFRDVAQERARQQLIEGWTPEHDDEHQDGSLAKAAACYAEWAGRLLDIVPPLDPPSAWPWAKEWWKPKDRRRDLVRAGGLILAEIERLDRIKDSETF